MKIIVIGAGAWGTALAVKAARQGGGHRVELWARDVAQAMALDRARENARYLPGIPLPRELTIRGGALPDLIADAGYADAIKCAKEQGLNLPSLG